MATCYILCRDLGSEGLAEPFIVFERRDEAEAAKRLVDALSWSPSLHIVEAPVYHVASEPEDGD